MSGDDYRWAQKAEDLKFEQLDRLRSRATEWRNGMVGLTALLGAVTIVSGKQNTSDLTPVARTWVIALLGTAFALLVYGSLRGMRAGFGLPAAPRLLDGLELRRWELKETIIARRALRQSQVSLLIGLILIALATGLSWLTPKPPSAPLVSIQTDAQTTLCGKFELADATGLVIKDAEQVPTSTQVPYSAVVRISIPKSCPASNNGSKE